ncbi:uncharacterized protein ALTATR162_LOCUS5077 [Alternaria atra]|uniref:Uncharacterized protein n=1 Tax=Alternaria atra TaxID=119953 RepID=A0A8J2HZB5_9PLEO|nr:uncharacterized protein ALTATR162_LOCUS5077 [Alternaria atra]CAG5158433.1 unnamed protein product [Alternaria atra]
MRPSQAANRDHELIKYLQLLPVTSSDGQSQRTNAAPFSFRLRERSTLRDALVTHVELLRLRLPVQGAFVVLTDGITPYFLAGTPRPQSSEEAGSRVENASWLGAANADLQHWLWIFQQTISVNTSPAPPNEKIFSILSLNEDDRSSKLSSVCRAPHLSFYAGTPITSEQGTTIGAVFVVDNSARKGFSDKDGELLTVTAEKCMAQLESARETAVQERWKRMNDQLCRFVGSRAIRDQQLEEPPSLGRIDQQRRRKMQIEEVQALALRHGQDPSKAENVALPENGFSMGAESNRLIHAEIETAQRVVKEDEIHEARAITAQANEDSKRSNGQGETTYRKIFRRAAECLQEALQVDGVLFTDGLVGYHGVVQPMVEVEEELEREMVQRPRRERFPEESIGDDPFFPEYGRPPPDAPLRQQGNSGGVQGATTRTYTSPEYLRGIYVERPAEILGMSTRNSGLAPERKFLNETTLGQVKLDEGHLQLLMDSCPDGNVWYFHDTTDICYLLRNDILVENESLEETQHLISNFPGVRQIIFHPLTDPVSLKRLAGCLAWSTRSLPVLSDTTDLPSLRGFLHVLESEISRIDASAAVKQKEAFISSISHELRTPLHGILGSIQLLADTDLDPFQTGLADTINSSGSALNETLTSVLSYARINQFERQQHKYRQRRPPDEDWSLPNKMHLPPGPETDFKGLYVCTNIALLCENIASVLEAGQSYDRPADQRDVTVVVEIDYEENWNYFTEPGALRRIAMNIIGNALKYTMEGSVIITLAASKTATGDTKIGGDNSSRRTITLTVKDTGKGISKDFMENHLFVPFTQEDTTSSHGVGLGMSIVKSLVSLLAGEIIVDSEPGKGSKVTVMVPMRLCDSNQDEMGKPALELERCTAFLRGEYLSVLLFGFPSLVRLAVEKYLREWFHCNLLVSTDTAEPDVVLVEEGNDEVASDVERTAQRYGRCGVLLSIAMIADTLAKPMRPIKGYRKWERIPRPIGPHNLGKALSACVVKLRELRGHRGSGEGDENDRGQYIHGKADHQSRDDKRRVEEGTPNSSRKRSQASPAISDTANSENVPLPVMENTLHRHTDTPNETVLPTRSGSFVTGSQSENPSMDPLNLRILVVEDNAVNRRLLGAFLKKYGCRHVQYAENGALAVKMVEGRSEGFDVIFMDLSMPVMNGFTATREIRRIEHERFSAQPSFDPTTSAYIVALTGLASDRDEDEALAAGVDKFVTKPVQFDKLSRLLKQREEEVSTSGQGQSS